MDDLDHLNSTNDEIVNWCKQWNQLLAKKTLGRDQRLGDRCANTLLRLNDHAVVKFGVPVTGSEAANQQLAWTALGSSGSPVRVPRVYRYFQDSLFSEHRWRRRVGYLVMEYVPGTRLSDVPATELPSTVEHVAQALQAMSCIKSENNRPGPVDGGEPEGIIWAPDCRAYEQFKSVDDLEAWFNRSLVKDNKTINLRQYPLSLCHLDLARRNILRVDDRTICLLDWATAGFYPRIFEIWNLGLTNGRDPGYLKSLVLRLECLSTEEQDTHWLLWCAYRSNMLHNLAQFYRKGATQYGCHHAAAQIQHNMANGTFLIILNPLLPFALEDLLSSMDASMRDISPKKEVLIPMLNENQSRFNNCCRDPSVTLAFAKFAS